MDLLKFIVKVFLLSAVISVFIKYLGPSLSVRATALNALIIVFFPTVVMACLLFWRLQTR